ncbi:MAG: 1-acyl-sn-glycerol-3-phosphate acyltransferase [Candidatus Omnitrophica bacterium]|nr:1-acyl-sn-glycerol-3-phosphate acyltransferase [Candidatus Omnitrophota bacterium]MCM8799877.1 1-acyl-sn-glycerol-3-phosphate acyltransferase [Candidatus Omnitrophota bacterium]
MLYYFLKPIAIFLCKILFNIKIEGKQFIPKKGAFILASNHLSYLDPIVLGVACPRRLNFMARDDLFSIPVFSSLIRFLGAFPIKRYSADISSFKEAFKRLKRGNPIVVFPQGRRVFSDEPYSALPGIGFLAVKSNVSVIPSYIKGTDEALPINAKFIRLKPIRVTFGKEIYIERRKPYNYQEVSDQIMEAIRRLK